MSKEQEMTKKTIELMKALENTNENDACQLTLMLGATYAVRFPEMTEEKFLQLCKNFFVHATDRLNKFKEQGKKN